MQIFRSSLEETLYNAEVKLSKLKPHGIEIIWRKMNFNDTNNFTEEYAERVVQTLFPNIILQCFSAMSLVF